MSDERANKAQSEQDRLRDGIKAWRERADKLEGALVRILASTRSAIDGRNQLDELFPNRWINITKRVDGVETTYEGDWLKSVRRELDLATDILRERAPPRFGHLAAVGPEPGGDAPTIAAANEEPNTWTPTRTDAEITVADLERLETKATAAERDQLLTAFEDDHIVERGPLIDAQTCDGTSPVVEPELPEGWERRRAISKLPDAPEIPEGFMKWEGGGCPVDPDTMVAIFWQWENGDICGPEERRAGDVNWTGVLIDLVYKQTAPTIAYRILSQAVETDQPEVPEVEEALPGDEADAESDDYEIVMGEPWPEASSQSAKAEPFTLLGGVEENRDQSSVLNDPELIAAVDRANASIAQDEPKPYVGCIDEELERDYDAAKARTTIKHEDAKKPFFAFLGAKPKHETEDA